MTLVLVSVTEPHCKINWIIPADKGESCSNAVYSAEGIINIISTQ